MILKKLRYLVGQVRKPRASGDDPTVLSGTVHAAM